MERLRKTERGRDIIDSNKLMIFHEGRSREKHSGVCVREREREKEREREREREIATNLCFIISR